MLTITPLPVSRIVNQAAQNGHMAVQMGGMVAASALDSAAQHTDFLQNATLNRLTGGRAAQLQAPIQAILEGVATQVVPQVVAQADTGVSLLAVAGKQYGWAANNVIRAAAAPTIDVAAEKVALAARQIVRGNHDIDKFNQLGL